MSSNIFELTEAFHHSLNVHDPPPVDGVATIQDLPTEVMTRIFFMATEHGYFSRALTDAAKLALSLCRVCRYWRTVVLSLPRFWGSLIDVVGLSDEEVAKFIEWSKPAPIDIFLDGQSELLPMHMQISRINSIQTRFTLVLQELERITYLYVRRLEISEQHCIQLQKPAPNLVQCIFEDGDHFTPLRLPALLFNNNAPKLHTLSLYSALIDFTNVKYPELKKVSINQIRSRYAPNVRSWLYFLSHHPSLESVDIRYCATEDYENTLEEVQPVDLHNVRELVVSDVATHCAAFLHHIIIPRRCNVTISSSLASLASHSDHQSLQVAYSRLMYNRLTKVLQVSLSGTYIQFINFINGDSTVVEGSPQEDLSISALRFQWNNRFHPFDVSLFPNRPFAFFPQVFLTNIERLRLVFPSFEGRFAFQDRALRAVFREWLGGLTEVKHLILDRTAFDHVFEIMHPRDSDSDSSDSHYNHNHNHNHNNFTGEQELPLLFPVLEGVEIMSVEGFFDWDNFIMFAECRKELGYPVTYITVPKRDINTMSWEEIGQVSELDIQINLK